jgi:hypothetical protein
LWEDLAYFTLISVCFQQSGMRRVPNLCLSGRLVGKPDKCHLRFRAEFNLYDLGVCQDLGNHS